MSSETADRWQTVEAVLGAALKVRPDEREALLAQLCVGDDALRAEVESLLAAHAKSSGFLSTSAESFSAPFVAAAVARDAVERPGALVGRYRLIEEIGHGGMGAVWLAERADGHFESRVALKLVRRGMDTAEIIDRFLRERQILARLEHPNIARLLDGGVDSDGRPYFVMEHVSGRPITQHCDAERLAIEDRLSLFVVTARAVAHAHRNLVVHRDIKPANVMVDAHGSIKLLDFGIAKLVSDDADPANPMTSVTRLMTREYASPEQLAGRPITTSSDIYQLGILLHELLTGHRPAATTTDVQVARPSSLVRAADTGETAMSRSAPSTERLARRLRGDLDTIVLRALREEPDRRYPSAEDLAEDVERHLAHRPIRFGGDRASYRARKFIRRNRLSVATTATVLVLAISFGAFGFTRIRRERDRARYESDKATEVSLLMARFLRGWSPDASDRGEVSTTKLLADAVRRANRELANRPDVLGATLSVLGDFHTTVGEWETADSLLRRAEEVQGALGERVDDDRGATLARRGRLYRLTGLHDSARVVLQDALALYRARFGEKHLETQRVQVELAAAYRELQQFPRAEELIRGVLARMPESETSSPFGLEVSSDLGYAVYQQGRFDEAIAILRPTLDRQLALFGEMHASPFLTMRALGSALRDRGLLDDAEAAYRRALRVSTALFGNTHAETETSIFILALVLERKRDLSGADTLMRQSLDMVRRIYGPAHPRVAGRLVGIGAIELDRGLEADAERTLRQAQDFAYRHGDPHGPDQGDYLNRLAYLLVRRGAPDAALAYRNAVAYDESRAAGQPDFVTDGLHFLAWAEHAQGDVSAAEADYRRALAVYERYLPATHPHRLAARRGLDALLRGEPPPSL